MEVKDYLENLKQRHRRLDTRIQEEEARPGSDELSITELKRMKLKIKDDIAHLEKEEA
jgi:hypothetical protein